jgi:two-component system LytT family sensor kinase
MPIERRVGIGQRNALCVPGAVALRLLPAAFAADLARSISGPLRSESFRGKLGTDSPVERLRNLMNPPIHPVVLFGQLIGYALSSTLAVVLAVLAWQSPDAGRRARALNAACAAVWSLGGLARFGLLAAGVPGESALLAWISCLTFSAAAAWPVCLLLFWEAGPHSVRRLGDSQRLVIFATITAAVLICTLVLVTVAWPQWLDLARLAVGYNALVVLIGAMLVVRPRLASPVESIAVALIPAGPLLSLIAHWIGQFRTLSPAWEVTIDLVVKQSMVLTILGVLVYLGRFQGSDRFAKLGLRVVFAWTLGIAVSWLANRPQGDEPSFRTAADAVAAAVICAATAGGVLLFVWLARATDRWVDRRVFGRSDPQSLAGDLRDRLARSESESSAFEVIERFFRETLNVEVCVAPSARSDAGVESYPLSVGDAESFALSVRRDSRRGLLLSSEVDLIRQGAQLIGRRLDALARERERIELSRREASLMHQLVDAELRALRAQINPHFLFNSLNTIAALVHQDPTLAESMTLRLARIFRYVLTQTEKSFSPLREEIDFLRAYLDIEQMRFGERLQVRFDVAEAIADQPVPSLILQPLVENAIKHGFSPKPGPCQLIVRCVAQHQELALSVEDDGVGAPADDARAVARSGIGLRNVRERLATVYGSRARLSFESQPRLGTRATVYLPLGEATAATA